MKYIYKTGEQPNFDKAGHRGYFFGTESELANHLISGFAYYPYSHE